MIICRFSLIFLLMLGGCRSAEEVPIADEEVGVTNEYERSRLRVRAKDRVFSLEELIDAESDNPNSFVRDFRDVEVLALMDRIPRYGFFGLTFDGLDFTVPLRGSGDREVELTLSDFSEDGAANLDLREPIEAICHEVQIGDDKVQFNECTLRGGT